jgi:hypothetical protein
MVVLLRRCRNGSAAGFSELSRAWWPPTLAELDRGLPLRKKSGRTLFASPPRCGLALRLPKIKRQDEITCRRPDTLVLTHRVSKNHGPTEDVTGWAGCKLLAASKLTVDLCVNVLVHPMRISPRQSGATRPCSVPLRASGGCKARPDRRFSCAGYVLTAACSAPAGSSPWFYRGVSSSPYTVHLCLGVSVPELCSVASRAARETSPSYLLSSLPTTCTYTSELE